MDGDPVTGEPSPFREIDEEKPDTNYTELFMKVFPEYMAMGMSYEEFWHGHSWLASAYRKAHKNKRAEEEWARWRQGAYIYDALLRVAPVMRAFGKGKVEPGKYPDEPWPLTQKEAQDREEARQKANIERLFAQLTKEAEGGQ